MGDADGPGLGEQRRGEPIPAQQSAAELRGNAGDQGLEHASSDGRKQRRPESSGGSIAGGCGLGFWSTFDLLPCADGKSRRIEPGSFPLAHGIPGRVGLLRGYGNAIVPQVAAEFIKAFVDVA